MAALSSLETSLHTVVSTLAEISAKLTSGIVVSEVDGHVNTHTTLYDSEGLFPVLATAIGLNVTWEAGLPPVSVVGPIAVTGSVVIDSSADSPLFVDVINSSLTVSVNNEVDVNIINQPLSVTGDVGITGVVDVDVVNIPDISISGITDVNIYSVDGSRAAMHSEFNPPGVLPTSLWANTVGHGYEWRPILAWLFENENVALITNNQNDP